MRGLRRPEVLHLHLSLGTWAADGLLAVFFVVAVWSSSASSSPATCATHAGPYLRTFLLTLAVVDDLLAITIIAFFYTKQLDIVTALLSLIPLAMFGLLVQRRVRSWWVLLLVAFACWSLVRACPESRRTLRWRSPA